MAITLLQPFNFDSSKDYTFANVTATANITANNANLGNAATANYFVGNGVYISNIAGANVSGTVANATYATTAGGATTAGTVTTAAQPNITSVGSLTGLTVSNSTGIVDFATTANVTLGAIANLHISGGTSGYVLQTDGTGNLSWTAQTGGGGGSGTPGGANTQLQFNDAGTFGGSAALTFNKTTNALALSGNLTVTNANITSNISVGSGSGGNITGANVITANYFVGAGNALSNITAANITGTVANANYSAYAGVVTTAAQPNITSVGTLTNTTLGGSNSLTGGNLVSANYLTGTLTTAAQPNITSVGTLSSLAVTANATVGNLIGVFANGNSNISIPAANGNILFSTTGTANVLVVTGTGVNVAGTINATGTVSGATGIIGGAITGQTFGLVARTTDGTTGPIGVQAQSATNYSSVSFFNNANLLLAAMGTAGTSATYYPNQAYMWSNNGIALSGNGYSATGGTKNLYISNAGIVTVPTGVAATNTTTGAFVVTGGAGVSGNLYAGNLSGTNITGTLTTAAQPNVTSVGTLSSLAVTANANVGNLNASSNLYVGASLPITGITSKVQIRGQAGQDPLSITNSDAAEYVVLNFFNNSNVQMGSVGAGNPSATYYANQTFMWGANGLALSGNGFSGTGGTKNLFISNAGIVTVPTGVTATNTTTGALVVTGGVGVSGNLYAGNLSGTNITGTLTTAAQPNITSVGTLSSLAVTANANVGNLNSSGQVNGVDAVFTGNLTVQGNTTYVNVETFRVEDPVIELGGGANGAALSTNDGKDRGTLLHYYTTGTVDAFMGWDNSNAEFAFGSNVSVASDVVTFNTFGNVRASYFLGNGSQLTGTVANANYSAYSGIAYSVSGANVSGTVANATYADSAGSATTATSATSATTAGTVTTAAQPNITSVGTLTGFASNGTVNFANATNVTLGSTSTIHISGGTSGYVLQTDGAGNLSWTAQTGGGGGGSVGGANTEVQYNDAGSFAGSAAFTFNNVSNTLTSANIVATANLTAANANLGNAVTANYFIGTFYGTANTADTATTAGTVTTAAQPNITSTGTLTSLTVSGLLTATGTGVKTANILDSTGTIAINTRYNSKAGSAGIYTDLTVGTSGTGNLTVNGNTNLGSNANVYISGGDPDYVLSTDGAGNLSWVAQTGGGGGGGSSIANGTSNVKIATSGGDITMTVNGTANVVTVASTGVTITGNTDLGANSNVLISGGTSGQVLATNGDGTLYWTTAGSSVVYQLDDLSSYTDGVLNTFMLAYNQSIVEITDPFGILVTINGATQPAWVWNTDTVWQNFTLSSNKGYTIITPGYITFADPPPAGAEIMVRTVTGTTNPVPRRYPFTPGDIMLG